MSFDLSSEGGVLRVSSVAAGAAAAAALLAPGKFQDAFYDQVLPPGRCVLRGTQV